MFNKFLVSAAVLSAAACSSQQVSMDYENDVVEHKSASEVVGKAIIPVDLVEQNLSLKVSTLAVQAKLGDADQATVNLELAYELPEQENQSDTFSTYQSVVIAESDLPLETQSSSRSCDNDKCIATQLASFTLPTSQLQAGQKDGIVFMLKQAEHTEYDLETMIPSRYLTALFAE